ncbi:MAG: hypothetical protein WA118_02285 [Carboxydocellales bacterium]
MRIPYRTKRKKTPLLPAVQIDGKPTCPGCRMRDKAEIVSYGISLEQSEHGSADGQLALDDYLGETPLQGKYKFIARCTRCSIRFHYTKDV